MKGKIFFTAMVFIASLGFVLAQTTHTQTAKSESKESCYVDANKDNVCDNYVNKTCTKENGQGQAKSNGKKQGNGQGKGQGCKTGNVKGVNFVDANKNGICDNQEVIK
jgi:hypothetical protein